ncbi:hypothetical protein KSP40_PGU022138 [Platanthera guangdongensis]|uniref:UspA domain-containing protein n=1 Tax=Platanthera guangdongensis TaxID=2320717 RepID=A0ABR2LDW0_9ASPA
MGRANSRLRSFCLNRVATRVRVRSPLVESNSAPPAATGGRADAEGRRIMIAVDSSAEARIALLWALSHSVQSNDTLVLLKVSKPGKQNGECSFILNFTAFVIYGDFGIRQEEISRHGREISGPRAVHLSVNREFQNREAERKRSYELSGFQKKASTKKGKMRHYRNKDRLSNRIYDFTCYDSVVLVAIELSMVAGKERGPAIVEEARKQGASLLVLGQKKRSMTRRLLMVWAGAGMTTAGVVEYCVHNSSCMTLAVRRKGRRGDAGYLITTRRHKDFWLLA